jgi:CRP-like cAMP-binding protein
MGSIVELDTRPARLRRDQADALKQALLPFVDDLPEHVRPLLVAIDRQTSTSNRWTFVMLSPDQNDLVVNYLASNSSRPVVAMRLWALCFRHLDLDTGEIRLTRGEIAASLSERVEHVSRIMGELSRFGAISRRHDKGRVAYFMNPRVGTHLAGKARDDAQASAPLLRLIEKDC